MPATYINHYAANGGAVVPQFGGWAAETDALAIKTLQATALTLKSSWSNITSYAAIQP
jgi:agmatine/peptidylarginine deiminase